MANGKRTISRFTLYSEDLLDNRGIRCLIVLLHVVALVLGLAGFVIGVISFANKNADSSVPQTNCTLTASLPQQGGEYPLSLHLMLTGILLVLVDIAVSSLLCIIKWKRCGVLAVAWYLVTMVAALTWTVVSVIYLEEVVPFWLDDKALCDYLVMLVTLVSAGYCALLSVAYLIVVMVVLIYECRRWQNMRDF